MEIYKVIGLMSGTSLDGLDVAYCIFEYENSWKYNIIHAKTYIYNNTLRDKLAKAHLLSGLELLGLHQELGKLWGTDLANFMATHGLRADFVASHGHTVFHFPEQGWGWQMGNPAQISAAVGLPVISDFRSADFAQSGQGAPLVPLGDALLFGNYEACLNLGGIANVSFYEQNLRKAYDICFVNMVLNSLAEKLSYEYDKDGEIAKNAHKNDALFDTLNQQSYFWQTYPKSLGREGAESWIFPILAQSGLSVQDQISTFTHHVAFQIGENLKKFKKILITGGGAYNRFLLELLTQNYPYQNWVVAPKTLIEYKEAMIFAFLGVLRWKNQNNILASVTGAKADSCGGAIYLY